MIWPFNSLNLQEKSDKETQTNSRRSSERKSQYISSSMNSEPLKTLPQLPPDIIRENKKEDIQFLLEDTQPRFNNGPNNVPTIPIKEAVNSIKVEDFKFMSLVQIPCFREAGLMGLSSLGVLGMVIFIAQKSPSKAANWGVGGFLLGSTIAWEQCRSKRKKEMAFAAKAKEIVASKEKPMLNKQNENLTKENEKSRQEVKNWWKGS